MKNFTRDDEKLRQTKPTKGAGAVPLMHAAYNLVTERLPVRFVQQTRAQVVGVVEADRGEPRPR
jgi:hypothetical protein